MQKFKVTIVLDDKALITLDFYAKSQSEAEDMAFSFADRHYGLKAFELYFRDNLRHQVLFSNIN